MEGYLAFHLRDCHSKWIVVKESMGFDRLNSGSSCRLPGAAPSACIWVPDGLHMGSRWLPYEARHEQTQKKSAMLIMVGIAERYIVLFLFNIDDQTAVGSSQCEPACLPVVFILLRWVE